MSSTSLTRFAWLSIAAAIITIGLKMTAYWLTNSVGLLSDAIESLVNLVAAIMALAMLTVAESPPDEEHAYGHTKAEYFSSGVEGALILIAAAGIGVSAWNRLLHPQPLEQIGVGLLVSVAASLINGAVALVLRRAGQRYNSIVLDADSKHLMTDVWTSAGVVAAVGAVALTGWQQLDPMIAILVALNIVWSGAQLMRRSALGLLDTAITATERDKLQAILAHYSSRGVEFHALRTRQAGSRRFMSVHLLTPGAWTVQQAHELSEQIEADLRSALPGMTIFTHLEPIEDPLSHADQGIDRSTG